MCYQLFQPPIDLFGEIPVTHDDLVAWVRAVSPVHLSERSFNQYVIRYNVADKVRWAKARGEFDAITAVHRPPYHARFALHQIV